jgi:hypothetical protein
MQNWYLDCKRELLGLWYKSQKALVVNNILNRYIYYLYRVCIYIYIYIYAILVYIKTNLNEFATNSEIYSHNSRRKNDLFILPCNTSPCKNNFNNIGIRMLNQLPLKRYQYFTSLRGPWNHSCLIIVFIV